MGTESGVVGDWCEGAIFQFHRLLVRRKYEKNHFDGGKSDGNQDERIFFDLLIVDLAICIGFS